MFGTFRFNGRLNEAEYVELSRDSGVDARGYTLLACNLCRSRKLKCSGDRGGCSRCLASSAECIYGPDGNGHRNSSKAGRSRLKGAVRQRRQQTAGPPSSSTPDDDEDEDVRGGGASGRSMRGRWKSPFAATDSAKSRSTWAIAGSSPDAPISNDWSSEWFDFNDLTDVNADLPDVGNSSPALLDDGIPAQTVIGTISPGQLLPPTCVPSTTSGPASVPVSVPVSPSPVCNAGSAPLSQRTELGLNRPGDGCRCLTTLAAILERLGRYRLGDKPKAASNLDCLLFCLGSGVSACNKVLLCKVCDACQENSILLATIAKQLVHICNDLCGCLLVHQHKARPASNIDETLPSTSARSPTSTSPEDPSIGSSQQPEADALVDGEISFGRYQIHGVEMRLRLIQNLMALHMTDFLALLDHMAQRIGQVDGATGMLTDARKMAITANWMLQRLQSDLHSKVHSAATKSMWSK